MYQDFIWAKPSFIKQRYLWGNNFVRQQYEERQSMSSMYGLIIENVKRKMLEFRNEIQKSLKIYWITIQE